MKILSYLLLWLICQIAAVAIALRSFYAIFTNQDRAWNTFVMYDWLLNTAANDDEKQPISTRAAKARRDGKRWGRCLCKLLDYLDTDHCSKNIGA